MLANPWGAASSTVSRRRALSRAMNASLGNRSENGRLGLDVTAAASFFSLCVCVCVCGIICVCGVVIFSFASFFHELCSFARAQNVDATPECVCVRVCVCVCVLWEKERYRKEEGRSAATAPKGKIVQNMAKLIEFDQ